MVCGNSPVLAVLHPLSSLSALLHPCPAPLPPREGVAHGETGTQQERIFSGQEQAQCDGHGLPLPSGLHHTVALPGSWEEGAQKDQRWGASSEQTSREGDTDIIGSRRVDAPPISMSN